VRKVVEEMKKNGWSWVHLRICSFALLGVREGNAWRREEYEGFFGDGRNARFLSGGDAGGGDEGHGAQGDDVCFQA